MMRFFLFILAASMLLHAAGLNLGNLEKVELKGFQTNGVTEVLQNGEMEKLNWTIRGDDARIQKPNYDLTGFQMTILDDNEQEAQRSAYHVVSPHCLYNQDTRLVRSESAIHLDGTDGFSISGVGYDIYLADEKDGLRIVIRDAVRIDFQLGAFQKWRKSNQQ